MRFTALFLLSVAAFSADYTIDAAHSSATFGVRHMVVSTVRGSFSKVAGKVTYDPKNLAASKVEATVDVTTINTNEPKRDEHLKSPDFFDAAKYPAMSFRSTKWTQAGGRLKIAGDLTLHGITKPVVLDADAPAPEVKGMGGGMVIGTSATTKISRKEFGLTWNRLLETGGAVVGDEVTITLDIEAKRN
ncbi:MAG: polyisoprenoid-binding protein [Bryobacterales bacterium]|nr:polyisoprenoid-binding protein [Bryobacterales bacterium]